MANGREYQLREGAPTCQAAVLSPDGKTLATVSGHDVHLWDAKSGELMGTLEGHREKRGVVTELTFSGDGQTLTSRSAIDEKEWHVKTQKKTASRLDSGLVLVELRHSVPMVEYFWCVKKTD